MKTQARRRTAPFPLWLRRPTIAGLFWLEPGENRFGSGADNEIVLPEGTCPEHGGSFDLQLDPEGPVVTLRATPETEILLEGARIEEKRLASDAEDEPDRLTLGRLTLWVIVRGDRIAIRIRDPESALRKDFRGLEHFPVDPDFRLMAALERFETTERETYGGGRFLSARLQPDGRVELDFNKAYNPPCAFNPHTTCPLPPPQNSLPVAVIAGEKAYGHEEKTDKK